MIDFDIGVGVGIVIGIVVVIGIDICLLLKVLVIVIIRCLIGICIVFRLRKKYCDKRIDLQKTTLANFAELFKVAFIVDWIMQETRLNCLQAFKRKHTLIIAQNKRPTRFLLTYEGPYRL